MARNNRLKVLLAKVETTYGTDAAPAADTDAVLVRSLDPTPLETVDVERTLIRPTLGNFQTLVAGKMAKLSIEMEVAGFGTAGPATATKGYDALLRGCGLAPVLAAGVSWTYTPISIGFESLTLYFYHDGKLHKLTGARGTMTMSFKRNEIPVYKFEFTGLYNTVTDTAIVTPTTTAYQQPQVVNIGNTVLDNFLGAATGICLESLDIDLGNSIVYRNLVNCTEAVLITDRQAKGSFEIEDPTVAQKDYYTQALNAALSTVGMTHGTAAGNKVAVTSTRAMPRGIKYGESDQIIMVSGDLIFVPDAGNDEISIVVK